MNTKAPKTRTGQVQHTGVYKADSIKDVAEQLNINIPEVVATALASDVEYRIHQVVEEAAKFMRHGRRTTMSTSDIDLALRVLNIEPLYGHTPHNPPTFRRAPPAYAHQSSSAHANDGGHDTGGLAGSVYFVEDDEIDFDRVLREEKILLPRGVSWTAHWLAVEGVQPLVPENPPQVPRDNPHHQHPTTSGDTPRVNGAPVGPSVPPLALLNGGIGTKKPSIGPQHAQGQGQPTQQQQLVKQVLSRELQLYYTRLTDSLLPNGSADSATWEADHTKRAAALASLRNDAGLQSLLPYLIRWVGEGVVGALKDGDALLDDGGEGGGSVGSSRGSGSGRVLEVLMEVIGAILDNQTLFVEPYLHQLLPPLLSTLLHSSLPFPSFSRSSGTSPATNLRISAARILSRLLTKHSTTYPSLPPRIMKTLLLALVAPNKSRSTGTREGAIRGLVGVGKEAVRTGVVEGGGARVVGKEVGEILEREGRLGPQEEAVVEAVMDALRVLRAPSTASGDVDVGMNVDADETLNIRLREVLGDFFADRVVNGDSSASVSWARAILGEKI